jgi:hypothetical protein
MAKSFILIDCEKRIQVVFIQSVIRSKAYQLKLTAYQAKPRKLLAAQVTALSSSFSSKT